MQLLPPNAVLLKKRFPEVFRILEKADVNEHPYRLGKDASGAWVMVQKLGKLEVSPYGRVDQGLMAGRWASGLDWKNNGLYALCGFGLGFQIQSLVDITASEEVHFFVAEKYPGWLRLVFSQIDCSKLLGDRRLLLGVGEVNDEMFGLVGGLHLTLLRDSAPFIYQPLYVHESAYYDKFLSEFARYVDFVQKLHKTNIADSALWQQRTLANLPYIGDAPDVSLLKGLFKDIPVILIAAGPSLDEATEFLKKAQHKAILVCVNSAYRKLVKNGIFPHITVAGDPRDDTFKGYAGCATDGVHLICASFVHPKVTAYFEGRLFTWSGANVLYKLIRKRLGLDAGSTILEQGTISACVPDFAHIWGSNRICFVGQDMALTREGKSHTAESFYADEGRLISSVQKCRELPGNTFETVPVEEKLHVYLKTFEQLIADVRYQDLEFINTSRLGVKIAGAPYKTYDEAYAWLGNNSSGHVRDVLMQCIHNKPKATKPAGEGTRDFKKFVKAVMELAWDGAVAAEMLPDKFENKNYADNEKVHKCEQFSEKLNALLDSRPEDAQVLMDGKTKFELYRYLENCQAIKSPSEHWARLQKNKEYCWAIAEGAYFMLDRLEAFDKKASVF